ncbi:MAG: PTS transporter subunit EIIA [Lentisphaerae bacterium]|mgnify:FL=1|nr:PTS transporter subunit EIIA [Lentisphaerota bacterium]
MAYQLLSLEKTAELLQMDCKTLRSLAVAAEIPCVLQGNRYLFDADAVQNWYSHRLLHNDKPEKRDSLPASVIEDLLEGTPITSLCRQESMHPSLPGRSRSAILKALTELAETTGLLYDPKDLYEGLRQREEEYSTAMNGGIAMPHPLVRDDFLFEDSFVCIAKTPRPVFFGQADDGQGTDLFFLICGLESFQHLQTLSRVSLLCSRTSLPEDLRAAETPAEMYAALQNAENALLALAQR